MLKFWITGLLVVAAFPAMAQETPVSAVCQILKTHNSTAAYQPGVDVNGNAVAPADLNAPVNANVGVIEIPVEVNLVQKFNMMASNGIKLEPTVSTFKIFPDGRVMYGNQDITQNAHVACGSKSSAILPPPQPQEPGILGTLTVKQPDAAPTPEAKPAVETVKAPEAEQPLAQTTAATPQQEVPLADQYCLQNGYVKQELQPGFVTPIIPVPVQPNAAASKTLSSPVPAGGEIIKAVPYENDEIPGLTNNKTVPDQAPANVPATQQNISVSTVPANNTPVAKPMLPKPNLPAAPAREIKSPETIPTFSNPVETRSAPSLPVRDVDKPLARPPGMPIESSWAPPPPKQEALSEPVQIAPPPFSTTLPPVTKQTPTLAAPEAAHPSKALRIDTNPLRRNLEETP